MKVIALSGSLRAGSFNTKLLETAAGIAPDGMAIEVATLQDIPLYNGDHDTADAKPAAVLELAGKMRASDGVLLSTPEYNYSFSGVLKNTIDWLSRVNGQPFAAKPVGIIGASAGQFGTARAQYHLRQVLVCLDARVMSRPEYFMGGVSAKFDENGILNDEASEKFLIAYLEKFANWTNASQQTE